MNSLSKNWLTEPILDFEYKKYTLLAYCQWLDSALHETLLFPAYLELAGHYTFLDAFLRKKQLHSSALPKQVTGIQWDPPSLKYKANEIPSEEVKEINQIATFGHRQFEKRKQKFETVIAQKSESMYAEQVGIFGERIDRGFVLIPDRSDVVVYRYRLLGFTTGSAFSRVIYDPVTRLADTIDFDRIELKKSIHAQTTTVSIMHTIDIRINEVMPFEEAMVPLSKQVVYNYVESKR